MEIVRFLIFISFLSLFQEVCSVDLFTRTEYETHGNAKLREILEGYLSEIEFGTTGDLTAQFYANAFSRKNAENPGVSVDVSFEKDGLSAIMFARDNMVAKFDGIADKINSKTEEIQMIVKTRAEKGESLIGFSVAYIPEDVWDNFLRKIGNALTPTTSRYVHLVIVLTFAMKTQADLFTEQIKNSAVSIDGMRIISEDRRLQGIADLWSTTLSNWESIKNIKSTSEKIWVRPFGPCSIKTANDHLQGFLQENVNKFTDELTIAVGWIRNRKYVYDNEVVNISVELSEIGQLVLVMYFPKNLSSIEEKALFDTFKNSFAKANFTGELCPLAKEIARIRRDRQGPIFNKLPGKAPPITENISFVRIVDFQIREAQISTGIPDRKRQVHYDADDEMLYFATKIRGVAFEQLAERDKITNSIKSCLILVLIVDESIPHGIWNLCDLRLSAQALESMYEFATEGTQPRCRTVEDKTPKRLEFRTRNYDFVDKKGIEKLKADVSNYLKNNQNGSVAVSVLKGHAVKYTENQTYWITIIYSHTRSEASSRYFKDCRKK